MTIFQAARLIHSVHDVTWSVALSWAWDCKREAEELKELQEAEKRAAFFRERTKRITEEKFLDRLRNSNKTLELRTAEGGWTLSHEKKSVKEQRLEKAAAA